ncbi:sensor histidine kinase [Catenovulum sp. SM1970]|uniref:ATP-binding protein n=1 Tax=Marinifaba aquimaris TaxID=2741323 RepID=UPI001574E304|nr:sensor histidine kinase [Marinifaba aquimaris]NTS78581.1 sensor histidine kinase [Marinifaba aquimaris]
MRANFGFIASFFIILTLAVLGHSIWSHFQSEVSIAQNQWQQQLEQEAISASEPILFMLEQEINFVAELAGILASTPDLSKDQIESMLLGKAQKSNMQISDRALGLFHFDGKRIGRVWSFGEARFLMSDAQKRSALRYQLNQSLQSLNTLFISMPEPNKPNYALISYAFNRQDNNQILVSRLDLGLIQTGLTHFHLANSFNYEFDLLDNEENTALSLLKQHASNHGTYQKKVEKLATNDFKWQIKVNIPNHYRGGTNIQQAKIQAMIYFGLSILVALCLLAWLWMMARTNKQLYETEHALKDKITELASKEASLKAAAPEATNNALFPRITDDINYTLSHSLTAISSLEERSIVLKERVEQGKMSKSQAASFVNHTIQLTRASALNIMTASEQAFNVTQLLHHQKNKQVETFYLINLIDEVLASVKPQLTKMKTLEQQLIVTIPDDLVLTCRADYISLLLQQLLLNAIKHGIKSKQAGVLMVEAFKGKKPGQVTIRIEDNGKGLTKEVLEQFNNPEATKPTNIALCFDYAKALEAELVFASKAKLFTRITLSLPQGKPVKKDNKKNSDKTPKPTPATEKLETDKEKATKEEKTTS